MSLTNVLGDLIVNETNNIESYGSVADFGKSNLVDNLLRVTEVEDTYGGSS
jgi:hypothetical protein